MHIVAVSNLTAFYGQPDRGDAEEALKAWYEVAKLANWTNPGEVKAQFGNASIVGKNRVVFNIAGNKYRLIVAFAYRMGWGYVKFVGTHAEYDAIDAVTVDLFK
ncbi:MAG: type II toxin-antitoxin system HigB family toxin [Xanthomonadaceae bacterium]|nr:type II toxin-antitoxin system HigB family toxin [Xanthomonadaceae bacterium]